MKTPSVRLISWTHNPIETVYLLWEASRTKDELPEIDQLKETMSWDTKLDSKVRDVFMQVIKSKIPVSENINFVFLLENVSVAFREQMVRHRVGVKVGERIGVDMVPDLHDSTWWSQTMRVIDMGKFVDEGAYHVPESIAKDANLLRIYQSAMHDNQSAYNSLVRNGVPPEDARMVIPMSAQHRISWSMNLATFAHIVSKRSCWIAQLGLWEPVIMGILKEVCEKVDPIFSMLATPPCMRGDDFKGCLHPIDCDARANGTDPGIPCPLHLHYNGLAMYNGDVKTYNDMCKKYETFWRRNVDTGEAFK